MKEPCLQSSWVQLFHSDLLSRIRTFEALDHSLVNASKASFTNHQRATEVLCGALQFRIGEYPEVARLLRKTWELIPPHRLHTDV